MLSSHNSRLASAIQRHQLTSPRDEATTAGAGADAAPADAIVVYDVPLLAENGLAGMYDVVVVVDAPEETQLDRLTSRRGMTEEDARARMANQATRERRRAVATHVIDNSGTLDDLKAQVDALWETLTRQAAEKTPREQT